MGFSTAVAETDKPLLLECLSKLEEKCNLEYEKYGEHGEFAISSGIMKALFGDRLWEIVQDSGNADELCGFTANALNSIQPPLGICNAHEISDEDEMGNAIANPVAAALLGYEISIPNDKVVLTHFDYQNKTYGFYLSDDVSDGLVVAMRNIDCFLSFINRPERIFRLMSGGSSEYYILAEPEKFKAIAKIWQITIH